MVSPVSHSSHGRCSSNVPRKSDTGVVCLRHILKLGNQLCVLPKHNQSTPGHPDFRTQKLCQTLAVWAGVRLSPCLSLVDWGTAISISPLQVLPLSLAPSPACSFLNSITAASPQWNLSFSPTACPQFLLAKSREEDANPLQNRIINPSGLCGANSEERQVENQTSLP